MVKPILKKLSHSEKNSLDLDRGWQEQVAAGQPWGDRDVQYEPATGSAGRAARDVSFSPPDGFNGGRPRFTHARSTSGTSVATTGSGGPRTTFVHPFQQIPRTATPPLSYANSLASLDNNTRDYSPTITEDDDDDGHAGPHAASVPPHLHHIPHSHSMSQSSLRRPSLASQRTASFTDITAAPPLRLTTSRSAQGHSSRFAHGSLSSSLSHSDLHLNLALAGLELPSGSAPQVPAPAAVASPTSSVSVAPMSPLRSSLEGVAFPRLRSRSEVDAGARAEHIREARRKFEARERAKEEKHDREMLKKRERRDHKEAKEIERLAAAQRNNSGGSDPSRLPAPHKPAPAAVGHGGPPGKKAEPVCGGSSTRPAELGEKQIPFMSSNYESMMGGTTPSFGPGVEDVRFQPPRRTNTAKKKTQGYWNGFILWLRTRLFRLGRN